MAVAGHLVVERLTLRHPGGVTAVDDISFGLAPGERLVLLGPSGCGKSSLLSAIAGFILPAAGRVLLDGVAVAGPGPSRMVVFQEFDQLLPWRTVAGNISFPLRVARRMAAEQAEAVAADMLERVGLTEFARAYPHTLSGGMKQRVAIARALALEPAVLLMDEPFAALDALTRRRMQQELVGLWEGLGFTLVFVTHAIDEAILVGSRILALSPRPGRILGDFDVARFDLDSRGSAEALAVEAHLQSLLLPVAMAHG